MDGACSVECKEHPEKRPYNGTGYYQKNTNGYNPFKGLLRRQDKEKVKQSIHEQKDPGVRTDHQS
jgi:UPF0176 protein